MAEEITSHQLDDMLAEVAATTQDSSVRVITREVWGLYDDLVDHLIVTSKQGWGYLNRILVLLGSDSEVEVIRSWDGFRATQCFAAAALAGYVYLTALSWFSAASLIGWAFPFGLISMALALANRRRGESERTSDSITAPFPSVSTLMSARRKLKNFERMRYPPALATRRIRSRLNNVLTGFPFHLGWLLLSPVVLVVQAMPDREARFCLRGDLREIEGARTGFR
jgi:hypothetical protein